jgi:hypothetical protein
MLYLLNSHKNNETMSRKYHKISPHHLHNQSDIFRREKGMCDEAIKVESIYMRGESKSVTSLVRKGIKTAV